MKESFDQGKRYAAETPPRLLLASDRVSSEDPGPELMTLDFQVDKHRIEKIMCLRTVRQRRLLNA